MHAFLRSVGFSFYKKERDVENLLNTFTEQYINDAQEIGVPLDNGETRIEIRAQVARNMGLCIVGVKDEDGRFRRESYYPYLISHTESTRTPVTVHKHIDNNQYTAITDDPRIGISLIFRLDNANDFLRISNDRIPVESTVTCFSAFSDEGKVLLPLKKTALQRETIKVNNENRSILIEAAKNGDQGAVESLTADEMATYAEVSGRLKREDIYSIVDTCFMPQGVECDLYSVIADIVDVASSNNILTGEIIYDLTLNANDMVFHVGINQKDLIGQPEPGRRFKGLIWLQGRMDFL